MVIGHSLRTPPRSVGQSDNATTVKVLSGCVFVIVLSLVYLLNFHTTVPYITSTEDNILNDPTLFYGRSSLQVSRQCSYSGREDDLTLSYPLPAYYPLPPLPLVMETIPRGCDLCWDKLEEHPNPCELLSERKVWNPDPHVREALVSALLPCTLSPGECNYLDGGGNMGVFSLWAWALGAKVVMVEPQVDLVKAMARTIRLNCAGDDIQVIHAGVTGKGSVGDKARGPLVAGDTFAVNNVWGTYSFRQCQPPQSAKFHTYTEAEVPAILIDNILLERPKWDLIKLDVDGFDLDLLDRILTLVERQEIEVVSCIIECNDARHAQYAELIVKAHALGYTVYKLNVHDNRRAFNEDGWDFVSVRGFNGYVLPLKYFTWVRPSIIVNPTHTTLLFFNSPPLSELPANSG